MFCCPSCLRSRRAFLTADAPAPSTARACNPQAANSQTPNPQAASAPAADAPAASPLVPDAPGQDSQATARAADSAGPRWIDVHCHVFNAIDLPISEFIDRTRLSSKLDLPIWPLVAILAGGLQKAAPSASAEAAQLNGQDAALPLPPPDRDIETALRSLAAPAALRTMAAPQPAAPAVPIRYAPAPSRGNAVLREALGRPDG